VGLFLFNRDGFRCLLRICAICCVLSHYSLCRRPLAFAELRLELFIGNLGHLLPREVERDLEDANRSTVVKPEMSVMIAS
jgi:hypothetical protein